MLLSFIPGVFYPVVLVFPNTNEVKPSRGPPRRIRTARQRAGFCLDAHGLRKLFNRAPRFRSDETHRAFFRSNAIYLEIDGLAPLRALRINRGFIARFPGEQMVTTVVTGRQPAKFVIGCD